jgi:hypothetical protein
LVAALALCLVYSPTPGLTENRVRPIDVKALPVALDPVDPGFTKIGKLTYRGGLELRSDNKSFGGYSGLIVDTDGRGMLAISDRGTWLAAKLSYEDGKLTGVTDARVAAMLDADGKPVSGLDKDAEALALDPWGGIITGFELHHRITRYASAENPFGSVPVEMAQPEGLTEAPSNKGLEAIAVLGHDRILLLTEDYRNDDMDTVGWILDDPLDPEASSASPVSFAVSGLFHPTDAAALPNGDVLVLERRYVAVKGGSMRLRRIPRDEIVPHARLSGSTLATVAPPLTIDNMEAVAVRSGPNREVFVYVMSDDNFSTGVGNFLLPAQRTLLMMFELEER